MSKRALSKRGIEAALLALVILVSGCSQQLSGAEPESGVKQQQAQGQSSPTETKQASFRFNGKEYVLSFGGKAGKGEQLSDIILPNIPEARLDNFVAGVHENSVTLTARITMDSLMDKFAEEFGARDWTLSGRFTQEGMASAKWTAKNNEATVLVYAMEENGAVIAKIVASRENI